jgi:glutamate racemase
MIGIFDSGLGGISCLGQAIHMLPSERFVYFGDSGKPPYSLLSETDARQLCIEACDFLVEKGVKAIVIACNTATYLAVSEIRKKYEIPVLGMEPAVKVAADYGPNGKIVILATGMTLKSRMVDNLIDRYGQGLEIVKLPFREGITLVESGVISGPEMEACIRKSFADLDPRSISSVVLGCTHFGFLAQSVKKVLGDHVRIADGNEGTIRNLKKILEKVDLLNSETTPAGRAFEIYNSGGPEFIENSKAMLKEHLAYLNEVKA